MPAPVDTLAAVTRPSGASAPVPPLRWLSAADVEAAMPSLDERLRLAELVLTALARPGRAELPPKIAIHPRPAGSFVHAMPAHLRAAPTDDASTDPSADLVGMKWVAGFGTNAARGLPAISATVILNDPATGLPIAILEGGPITAQRTAAVSGVAIRRFGPGADGWAAKVALIGAGAQGHSHLPVLGRVLPGSTLIAWDPDRGRLDHLLATAAATNGLAAAHAAGSARLAVDGADVVVTAAAFLPPAQRQVMDATWLGPEATVVAVDYDTYCAASLAAGAALFLVDHREQFLANRDGGGFFAGYPDPSATLGEAILAGDPRPAGRVVVTHLGVGLADVVFADAIVRTAVERGLGTILPR